MIAWIAANIGTILAALAVLAIVVLVVVKMAKDKKRGVSSCGCDCASCAYNCGARAAKK